MAGRVSGRAGTREWSTTADTRRMWLRAAREVFTEKGFAGASVADVVERAGSSVGSLYHHFGGKAELFGALWEQYQAEHERHASAAVAAARDAGEGDPLNLLIAGAGAILDEAWRHRDLGRLFTRGDGPPEFESTRRTRGREWVRRNAALLGAADDPAAVFTVTVLTSIIGEASREMAACQRKKDADTIAATAIEMVRRLDPRRTG